MGPEATILLMQRIVASVSAEDDRDHIPMIVDNNTQVPSRIDALIEKTGEDPGPVLAEMARNLEKSGAEALAMPCNTAHHYAGVIDEACSIPFLNMVDLACQKLRQLSSDGAQIGILGSPALQIVGLYDKHLSEHGLQPIYPKDNQRLLQSIRSIKKIGPTAQDRQILMEEAVKLETLGVEALLIACSEFSLISQQLQTNIPLLDSLDILAAELVAFSMPD